MSEPTITDEELAEIVRAIHFYCGAQSTKADRLIAALRAERAEVAYHINAADLATAEAARLGDVNAELRQQIATLTARLESSQRMREVARQRNEKMEKELALLRKAVAP